MLYNGTPLVFEREKAKELLALLIDRQGLSMTNGEIEAFLWEELHSPQYLQTLFYSLRKTLRGIGFEDLLIRTRNHTSIDVSKLHCDLYEFLRQRRRRKQLRRRVHEQLQLGRADQRPAVQRHFFRFCAGGAGTAKTVKWQKGFPLSTLHKGDAPRRLLQLNLTIFRNGVALLVTPFLFSCAPRERFLEHFFHFFWCQFVENPDDAVISVYSLDTLAVKVFRGATFRNLL
ncbi:MAG: hypothetical protein EP147_01880 [Subdoligranulum sp.]|nr:hypothetical protein [Subdoligranulum sp.]